MHNHWAIFAPDGTYQQYQQSDQNNLITICARTNQMLHQNGASSHEQLERLYSPRQNKVYLTHSITSVSQRSRSTGRFGACLNRLPPARICQAQDNSVRVCFLFTSAEALLEAYCPLALLPGPMIPDYPSHLEERAGTHDCPIFDGDPAFPDEDPGVPSGTQDYSSTDYP